MRQIDFGRLLVRLVVVATLAGSAYVYYVDFHRADLDVDAVGADPGVAARLAPIGTVTLGPAAAVVADPGFVATTPAAPEPVVEPASEPIPEPTPQSTATEEIPAGLTAPLDDPAVEAAPLVAADPDALAPPAEGVGTDSADLVTPELERIEAAVPAMSLPAAVSPDTSMRDEPPPTLDQSSPTLAPSAESEDATPRPVLPEPSVPPMLEPMPWSPPLGDALEPAPQVPSQTVEVPSLVTDAPALAPSEPASPWPAEAPLPADDVRAPTMTVPEEARPPVWDESSWRQPEEPVRPALPAVTAPDVPPAVPRYAPAPGHAPIHPGHGVPFPIAPRHLPVPPPWPGAYQAYPPMPMPVPDQRPVSPPYPLAPGWGY
ncbi:MAG: hypothetical protein EOM91_00715 [Sphingobacteriia bacterium]|nr:hypothetical protein [Sphingobacteriia bacterium]NCC38277.1 hypothetical protein [Gammaproteobacteria bacterium]